jgi:hypothetical protein
MGVLRADDRDPLALARGADAIPIAAAVMVARARVVADCRPAGPLPAQGHPCLDCRDCGRTWPRW